MHCIRCTSPRPAHILHIENIWVLSLDTRPYGPLSFLCKSFLIFREKYLNYVAIISKPFNFSPDGETLYLPVLKYQLLVLRRYSYMPISRVEEINKKNGKKISFYF